MLVLIYEILLKKKQNHKQWQHDQFLDIEIDVFFFDLVSRRRQLSKTQQIFTHVK